MGGHFLLQRIFPAQESNQGLLHCRQILYRLSYEGNCSLLQGISATQGSNTGLRDCRWILFFFSNNRTILLKIWTYLFCTTHISFFPLPQEASAIEPHVYKNTLWQLLWQGEKSAILKVTTHNQSGEQKREGWVGPVLLIFSQEDWATREAQNRLHELWNEIQLVSRYIMTTFEGKCQSWTFIPTTQVPGWSRQHHNIYRGGSAWNSNTLMLFPERHSKFMKLLNASSFILVGIISICLSNLLCRRNTEASSA